jgi:hypothetical protein
MIAAAVMYAPTCAVVTALPDQGAIAVSSSARPASGCSSKAKRTLAAPRPASAATA